ncbi:hypothetical protein BH11MYX3_BH11MYX3_19060 [soil metagenome]
MPPSAASVDRMAMPRTAGIGAPPRVQAGDLAVGRHVGVDVPIFNLDPTADAVLSVALAGAPSLSLLSAPDRLWPSRSGFDPSKVVRLEFRPTEVGRIHGDVAVTMSWPNGSRPDETVHIEVAGGAHLPNDEPLDVQDAMRASHELTRQAEAARDTQRARTDQAILDEEQRDTHYHEGHKRRLDNARSRAAINLTAVYSARHDGIEKAGEEIGEFVRHLPPESGSLAQDLAGFALDLASAAIAGGLAKRLEPGIKKIFGTQGLERNVTDFVIVPGHDRQDAGPGIVGLVADGVKHVTKAVGKRGKEAVMPGAEHHDERHGAVSLDAKSDFLETHRAALRNDTAERAAEVTIRTHDALLPTLQTDHEKAIAAMNEVAVQLGAEAQAASGIQKHQSHLQWIRLVAQTSLGSTDASTATARGMATRGDASLTDMARANQTRDENTPMKRHDGLIDITFTGSEAHPEQKVKVTGIKLTGVRSVVAKEVTQVRMLDLGLPVRASGFLGGPSASVTVVRDEAGNLTFSDHTTVPWQQATWLARKAGVVTGGGDADERRGARQLIEDEIMTDTIRKLSNDNLETDSES